jgi:hypothetical protein
MTTPPPSIMIDENKKDPTSDADADLSEPHPHKPPSGVDDRRRRLIGKPEVPYRNEGEKSTDKFPILTPPRGPSSLTVCC